MNAANNKNFEKSNISNFIKNISKKNYAEANKYLKEVIDSKLKERIKNAFAKEIF